MPEIIFETQDISLAAYLTIKGYQASEPVLQGNHVIFGFIDSDQKKRKKDVLDYFNNSGNFRDFSSAHTNLKTLLHQTKKNVSR